MKKILYIFIIAILAFSCDESDDNFDFVQLKDASVSFNKDTIRIDIIGESIEPIKQFVTVGVDLNVIKATSFIINVDNTITDISNSDGKLIYSFPSHIDFRKGDINKKIQFDLNTNLIPIDEEVRTIKYDLETSDCKLGEVKSVVFKIQRIMKPLEPQIEFSSKFWGWENGDWVNPGEITIAEGGTWVDLSFHSWKWCGLWKKGDGNTVFESNGNPIAAYVLDGVNMVSFLEEGDLISKDDLTWYDNPSYNSSVNYNDIPLFGTEWYGKTSYIGIRMTIDDVEVNGWILVKVEDNSSNLTLLEYAYEKQGLPIKAGQKF